MARGKRDLYWDGDVSRVTSAQSQPGRPPGTGCGRGQAGCLVSPGGSTQLIVGHRWRSTGGKNIQGFSAGKIGGKIGGLVQSNPQVTSSCRCASAGAHPVPR